MIHEFKAHVREETSFLEAYERLVAESSDESVRFLLELIVADEHRHHELFSSMAEASVGDGEEGLPQPPRLPPAVAARLLEPTEHFLAAERDESKKLAALRRDLRPVRDDTLWPLLIELMEIDTHKHVRILEYLQQRLRQAGPT